MGKVWRVIVDVPADLPEQMIDDLFEAVCDAVDAWEPDDRENWDAFVAGRVADEDD